MADTIFACSSGMPPAAIAVVRVSGPLASEALRKLAGRVPARRRASLATLRSGDGGVLDHALVLWFPGPDTATGEDIAEFHLHGGRAVVAAVEGALGSMPGLRRAEAGEFTRRAFAHGRIDLAEAEGLGDLLAAETELQRQSAMALADGGLSRQVRAWRDETLRLSALVEAALDFSDEDDVGDMPWGVIEALGLFHVELSDWLARPRAEVLREGFKVVIAGPPNAGKSTLFNALVGSEAAIITPLAGTTRDVLMRSVALSGVAFQFFDTAGLHEAAADIVEEIGIGRAMAAMSEADLVLWLGPEGEGPDGGWEIAARVDCQDCEIKMQARHRVSAATGEGMDGLRGDLVAAAHERLPRPGAVALNARQHGLLSEASAALAGGGQGSDLLLVAEHLRLARLAFDRLLGGAGTEDMLDALFGRFCIGK